MELELAATADGVMDTYLGEGREPMLASIRDDNNIPGHDLGGYSPNLFNNCITCIYPLTEKQKIFTLNGVLGEDLDLEFQRAVDTSERTYRNLLDILTIGEDPDGELRTLAKQHIKELDTFANAFNVLSSFPTKEILQYAKNTDLGKRLSEESINSFWQIGIISLAEIVLRANSLYDPESRPGFLSLVSEGMLDDAHRKAMLAPYSGIPALS
jgi:hypothetical protein